MKKILIVLLNVILIFTFIGFNYTISFASEGSISAPSSVTVGDTITVTVTIPSDAVAYQGEISVKCSDGSVQSSGVLANVTGITGDYAHPGNMTYSATAKSEGTATITVSNLNITDRNGHKVNANSTLTANVTVNKKQETTTPATSGGSTSGSTTTTPTTTSNDPTFTNTSETVYATETVNVRSGWGTSYSSMGKLEKGKSVIRTAKGSNGWDRVTYNGKIGYIMSKYLTTTNPDGTATTTTPATNTATNTATTNTTTDTTVAEPTWRETGDKVYATTNMNVREGWDKSFKSIGGLMKGDSTTRIAVGSNGWDKIKFEGKTAYVLSRLLTTEVVEPDEPEEDENTTDENEVANKVDVTANMANEEKDVYNQIIEEVGVLPAVGKSYADYVYIIAVMAVAGMVGFVGLKIREKDGE